VAADAVAANSQATGFYGTFSSGSSESFRKTQLPGSR
jgi:hypothetical protein